MNTPMQARYDPQTIEARRQEAWRERHAFKTPDASDGRPCRYVKPSSPFTSGNIHMGHVRSYAIGDAYARFLRARGNAVLFAFGWDAFGLPAELGAIANGESPAAWVKRCSEHMTGQLQRMGFSFDFHRLFTSSDAEMYQWSQWLFLTFLDAGLIYRGTGNVDWCESCSTTLATLQVEDGTCWRCHGPVRLIQQPQWYLRISAYLEENDQRLEDLENWDQTSLSSQRYILGRTDGVEVDLTAPDGRVLTVFTPHADAFGDAHFVLVSPRHPEVGHWANDPDVQKQIEEIRSGGWERSSREAEAVPVVDTGHTLIAPDGGSLLPVLVSPAVDARFGVTAVLGIPNADRADQLISQRVRTPAPHAQPLAPASRPKVRPALRYRAFDFSISRQRSWGTPIPIVHCPSCGTVPVPLDELPVRLPRELKPTGAGSPLAECPEFVATSCPKCGTDARRETDTLDCHFDALWMWIPSCVPNEDRSKLMFDHPELRRWLPSERLVAGSDSGGFIFDQRFTTKALRDIGPLSFMSDGEPFAGALMHEMVIRDGRKMSKHLGNTVDPDELLARYGADTVRLAVLYAARPQRSLNWSDSALQHCHRFLSSLWEYAQTRFAVNGAGAGSAPGENSPATDTDHLRKRLSKWCEIATQKITEDLEGLEMHSAVRNVMRLFERIKDYESRVIAKRGELGPEDFDALVDALALLARVLTPFAPHVGEELWIASGQSEALGVEAAWPMGYLVAS